MHIRDQKIIIRGGGDLATGVVQPFARAGFKVLILETDAPTAIRRSVALCEAVYNGTAQVEDISCTKVESLAECDACWENGVVPLLVDPAGACIAEVNPTAVIDAILAKRNLGTHRGMSNITIGLGPGFTAKEDVDVVIETMRGHDLGRLIFDGSALPDTGTPGLIAGKSTERVIHSPASGVIEHAKQLGDIVEEGEIVFTVGGEEAPAPFTGLIRGLIRNGMQVKKGLKVADIDARTDVDWHTISDKARALGGSALAAYFYCLNK